MSDVRKPPGRTVSSPSNPASPTPGPPSAERPARTLTNPGALKVVTATRAQPPPPDAPKKLGDRVKAGATDTALNAVSIARDLVADFQHSDRYFKYKAAILGSWLLLSIGTLFVSCPHSELDAKNRLGARLGPASTDPLHPAITIFNESDDPWKEVTVIVNQQYRAAVGQVTGHGGYITVTPKQLMGPDNKLAPPDLRVSDVELKTDNGKARLMKQGEVQ